MDKKFEVIMTVGELNRISNKIKDAILTKVATQLWMEEHRKIKVVLNLKEDGFNVELGNFVSDEF